MCSTHACHLMASLKMRFVSVRVAATKSACFESFDRRHVYSETY